MAALGPRMDAITRVPHALTKALLYYYFHDQEALYVEVLDQFFRPLLVRLRLLLDCQSSPGERILGYARAHFDTIAEKPHYARLFQSEMMSAGRDVSPRISEIVDRYAHPLFGRLPATLQRGVGDSSTCVCPPDNPLMEQ